MPKHRRLILRQQPRVSAQEYALGTGTFPVKERFARLQRDAVFLLLVLALTGGTVFALASGGAALERQAHAAGTTPPPRTHVVIGEARAIVDRVASSNVGLMQPAVDAQGNVWVGEMYANRFARFDSQSEAVTTWTPPKAHYGIMDTTIDAHGNPWFGEQGANYLGRFDRTTSTFRIFPLGSLGGRPLGPQDLQFDKSGSLWFTASVAGRIGRLDPATGHVTLSRLADPQAQIFSMASSARGRIWFTEMVPGKLGMFDPTTNKMTEIPVPAISGHPAALYGLVVTPRGDIWFANSGANALMRYSPATATYTFYQLSTAYGGLYGLALDSAGQLWFTIDGTSANYIGELFTREKGT
jgi:streptogramin lyase